MRRAMVVLILVASTAALLLHAPRSLAKGQPLMNAIGLIDYSHKPTFKPGDWVRYRVTGANSEGEVADYDVTILIAGEERFWGEDCFWVETRSQAADVKAPVVLLTLMSYSIFDDSLAMKNMKLYMRKTITDANDDGTPRQDITKRPPLTLKNRQQPSQHTAWSVDTVGTDTVSVPAGLFTCAKVKMVEGVAATSDRGDSTTRTEVRDIRTDYFTDQVPITRLAREEIENSVRRKRWAIGHSQDTALDLIGYSKGEARFVDSGHGLESGMVPARFRKSLREQFGTANRVAPARATKSKAKRPS